jgi:hypothetical protein
MDRILANPFYCLTADPLLAEPHAPFISDQTQRVVRGAAVHWPRRRYDHAFRKPMITASLREMPLGGRGAESSHGG